MRIGRGRFPHDPAGLRLVAAADPTAPVVDLRKAAESQLRAGGATDERARAIAASAFPGSLTEFLAGGAWAEDWARDLLVEPDAQAIVDVELACPVDPPSYRDFMCFDEHVETTYALAGRTPPGVLQERPAYYKGSTATLVGPDETVRAPWFATDLDYELEVAFVIGRPGVDLDPSEAEGHIFGATILNDFSARELQFSEMRSRLGPAKGKDFATAVGPWVVTTDELELDDIALQVLVNGAVCGTGSTASAAWTPGEIVSWASTAEPLRPGDLLGYGAIGGGTGLETDRRLHPGDVVELHAERIGRLRSPIGPAVHSGAVPVPRTQALTGSS